MIDKFYEKVKSRENLFDGVYLHLERLNVELPDGNMTVREIVRVPDAVAVILIDENNNVILVRQHRPAIGRTLLEIPAGLIDRGENAVEAARRECEEETGFIPQKLNKLTHYAHAVGYSTGWMTLFLGTDIIHTGNTQLDPSEFLEVEKISFQDLLEKIQRGEIVDTKTILGGLMAKPYLKISY